MSAQDSLLIKKLLQLLICQGEAMMLIAALQAAENTKGHTVKVALSQGYWNYAAAPNIHRFTF